MLDLDGVLLVEGRPNRELFGYLSRLQKGGIRLLILSNFSADAGDRFRQAYPQEAALFEHLFFAGETGRMKPSAESFLVPLQESALEPDDVVFVDDVDSNVSGAREVGMKGFRYVSSDQAIKELQQMLKIS